MPISLQWYPNGHIYPVQVAQFGLSHFSRWKSGSSNNNNNESSIMLHVDKWIFNTSYTNCIIKRLENGFEFDFKGLFQVFLKRIKIRIFNISFSYLDGAYFELNKNFLNFISNVFTTKRMEIEFKIIFIDNSSIKHDVKLVYRIDNEINTIKSESIYIKNKTNKILIRYLINGYLNMHQIARNLCIDTCKALKSYKCQINDLNEHTTRCKVLEIRLYGTGIIKNAMLKDDISFELAKLAADYLVNTQINNGWPIKIKRKFNLNDNLNLNDNWNSAMMHGHALSLLCRLYIETQDLVYLKSAFNSAKMFLVNTSDNGIRSYFMNRYVWYEEYPTRPNSIFVLNGFLYSLFGLYDLYNCLKFHSNYYNQQETEFIFDLYNEGIESLKNLLNLFDTGSRTYYDLRHILNFNHSLPNIARWDYHMLHINQLLHLLTIKFDIFINNTVHRWIGYTVGEFSKHN